MRILTVTVVLVAALAAIWAMQKAPKPHRVGLLSPAPASAQSPNIGAFYDGLRERGHVEGQNLILEWRYGDAREDRLASAARELVDAKVDVIVAFGPSATRAAMRATSTIPIVMSTFDAVEQGLVKSLSHPGGNVTGWSVESRQSGARQLALLKEALPGVSRVGAIHNPAMPGQSGLMQSLKDDASRLGLDLYPVPVSGPDQLTAAFMSMREQGLQAFFVIAEPAIIDQLRTRIVALAAEHRIPAMYPFSMYVDAGGLMSYGPSLRELVGRSAHFVDRILDGAKPADIPVETADKYGLDLNLETAQALGITFPLALRAYAQPRTVK